MPTGTFKWFLSAPTTVMSTGEEADAFEPLEQRHWATQGAE